MSKSELALLKHILSIKHDYKPTGLKTVAGDYILELYHCNTCGRNKWSIIGKV